MQQPDAAPDDYDYAEVWGEVGAAMKLYRAEPDPLSPCGWSYTRIRP